VEVSLKPPLLPDPGHVEPKLLLFLQKIAMKIPRQATSEDLSYIFEHSRIIWVDRFVEEIAKERAREKEQKSDEVRK